MGANLGPTSGPLLPSGAGTLWSGMLIAPAGPRIRRLPAGRGASATIRGVGHVSCSIAVYKSSVISRISSRSSVAEAVDFWQRIHKGESVGVELAGYGQVGARMLGITVHDHVIVGRQGHVSLKAKGLI